MYVPVTQANIAGIRASHTYFPMSWVVRTDMAGPELIGAIREAMRATDPRQPFSSFATMEDVKSGSMSTETFQMRLLSGLAGVGLLLAFAGIYGLIAYMVASFFASVAYLWYVYYLVAYAVCLRRIYETAQHKARNSAVTIQANESNASFPHGDARPAFR